MQKKRKTEISLEIEEAVAIRTVLIKPCRQCHKPMPMVTANEAAVIAKRSAREIYRFVEDGRIHFIEDHNGLLFVCIASLEPSTDRFKRVEEEV